MNFFNSNTSQMAIVAFCDWFAKLSIEKYQTVTVAGSEDIFAQRKIIPVPCQWATKEKFVEILRSSSSRKAMNPDIRDKNPVEMQWILPRISVNLTGMSYDSARRLIKTQRIDDQRNAAGQNKNAAYSPTPYNLNLEVCSISRNIDENFQIMEQILPFFSPAMNFDLKLGGPGGESESIKVVLNSVNVDNPTDIPENDERIFTTTYEFTMQLNYFIPKRSGKIIYHIDVQMIDGIETIKLDKDYIEALNVIQDKFSWYMNNALMATPVITTNEIPSTYNKTTGIV
jgi:hypothetical protein